MAQIQDANNPSRMFEVQGLDGAAYVIVRGGLTSERPNLGTGHASVVFAMDDYETVAASQTDQILGAVGAGGDYLHQLICVVTTAATAQVQIKDGGSGSAITVFPNSPGGGIGTYTIPMGLISTSNGWRVTTGAGVAVIASGVFT